MEKSPMQKIKDASIQLLGKSLSERFTIESGYRVEFVDGPAIGVKATSLESAVEQAIERCPGKTIALLVDSQDWFANCILPSMSEKHCQELYF